MRAEKKRTYWLDVPAHPLPSLCVRSAPRFAFVRPLALCLFGRLLYTELQLKPNDALFQVVEKFPRYVAKYTHTSAPAKWIFLYKREAMVPLLVERKAADKEAIKLFFHEVSALQPPTTRYGARSAGLGVRPSHRLPDLALTYDSSVTPTPPLACRRAGTCCRPGIRSRPRTRWSTSRPSYCKRSSATWRCPSTVLAS